MKRFTKQACRENVVASLFPLKIFIYIYITADSTLSAFWASSVQSIYIYIYIHIYICIYIYIYIQIEHSIWDESLLLCNCACSLEYSSLSTLAGLSYHICGKLEVAFQGSPSSQYQHCTDEAQKAEIVLSAVIYIYFVAVLIQSK